MTRATSSFSRVAHGPGRVLRPGRSTWKVLDPSGADFDDRQAAPGDFTIVNHCGRRRVARAFTSDRGPVSWYKWDAREEGCAHILAHQARGPAAGRDKLVVIKSRDGLSLNSYRRFRGPRSQNLPRFSSSTAVPGAATTGLQPDGPVAGQPGLRGASGELPASTGRKEISERRKPSVGTQVHDDPIDAAKWAIGGLRRCQGDRRSAAPTADTRRWLPRR